jgi:hypothetical protein
MASQGFGSDGGSAREELRPASDKPKPDAGSNDPSLLDAVLQRTQAAEDSTASTFENNMGPLLQVLLRHRGAAFTLEPVAVDLVQAALEDHFRELKTPQEYWHRIAREVARTLFEDPVAHDRLERFWIGLTQKQP